MQYIYRNKLENVIARCQEVSPSFIKGNNVIKNKQEQRGDDGNQHINTKSAKNIFLGN